MRVLLVEDDAMIGEAIVIALKDAAYAVDWVRNAAAAIDASGTLGYDFVLLDLGLPGASGMTVLTAIRQRKDTVPILIISARDSLEDRIGGLDGGADDYVVKPFDMREMLARMRAVVRRRAPEAPTVLGNGVVWLDPATHEARLADGEPVRLSNREYALLHALLFRPGAILSRNVLEQRLYGWGEEVDSNAVEFLIHSVRRRLGSDVIKNVRGVGWMVARNP
ncbi:MAG: response regulator [Pseudomonadota bacterium]|nr:response regulator [Pseudomonadota bacterium]